MQNWKAIAIPTKMKDLPKYKRGYPIPFTVSIDATGIPNFAEHNPTNLVQYIQYGLCSLCGQPLDSDIWLVAGAKTALESTGVYIDPPVHGECGIYALQVCPYLAIPSFKKRLRSDQSENDSIVQLLPGKSPVFGFAKTAGYQVALHPTGIIITIPVRSFLAIEFWKEGQKITASEPMALLQG